MTNNDCSPIETASGRLSHRNCTHPPTAAARHNCRYYTAVANFEASAARRAARGPAQPLDLSTVVWSDMKEA